MKKLLFLAMIAMATVSCGINKKVNRHTFKKNYFLVYKTGEKFFEVNPQNSEEKEIELNQYNQNKVRYEKEFYLFFKKKNKMYFIPTSMKKDKEVYFIYYKSGIIHIVEKENAESVIRMKLDKIYNFFTEKELNQELLDSVLRYPRKIFWIVKKRNKLSVFFERKK